MPLKGPDAEGRIDNSETWDDIVTKQIKALGQTYTFSKDRQGNTINSDNSVSSVLSQWHRDITLGIKRNDNYSPHVNGFYMVFMVHGTWYNQYLNHTGELTDAEYNPVKEPPPGISRSSLEGPLRPSTVGNTFNMLATDIDVPDITEEYISVSSRLRNSFIPSRNYFVSDFSISYIENVNLEIMRYHEAWHKYLELLKRGEIDMYSSQAACLEANPMDSMFLDMPFTNAVWIAVFRPFTTDIQLLIKLIGVMPVTMPLKQVIGNRSSSKLTVLNLQYKAADIQYKFYNGTKGFLEDTTGLLQKSFNQEVISQWKNK